MNNTHTALSTLKSFFKKWSLELTILLAMTSLSISENCSLNLMFQKACDNDGDGPKYLGTHCPTEKDAQKTTAGNNIYRQMINSFTIALVHLYAGTWSDSHGNRRRPLVFIPLLGQIITDFGNVFCSYFWSTSSLTVSLINGFVPGISGGRLLMFTGANAYLSDTTSFEDRTFRLGFVASMYLIATPVGDALSGFLTVNLGFIIVFLICVSINGVALLIGLYFIEDTSVKYDPASVEKFTHQIWGNVQVAIRKRPSTSRKIILLALAASPLVRSPVLGEQSVLYLFVRYKFGWNEADFGYFAAFKLAGIFCGTLFSMGILSKCCGMSDSMIGILASISDMAAATCYIFVTSSWQMYAVPMLDIFHGACQVICASIITKNIEPNEFGKVQSVKAFFDSLTPFLVTPLYNKVYIYTFQTLPSAFFIISLVFGFPILIVFLVIRKLDRGGKPESNNNNCRESYSNFNNNEAMKNKGKTKQQPEAPSIDENNMSIVTTPTIS
uniref:Proton-coupled folate transporter n=1 Tax=Cacopsylla melanoneura TaxID=428564 RepID=A0A8D9FFE0_9HEMI